MNKNKNIVITNNFSCEVKLLLKKYFQVLNLSEIKNDNYGDNISDVEGLICMVDDIIDKKVIDLFPRLKIISNTAVGFNNIDYEYAYSKDIVVATIDPKTLVNSVVQFTFSHILSYSRKIREADKYIREKKFKKWSMDLFVGNEINDKILGIVGFGSMGKAIVPPALSFGMKIIYNNKSGPIKDTSYPNVKYCDLDELLKCSDYVLLLLPLNNSTRHLIDTREFKLMKKSAILINMARGPIVNEKSLITALKNDIIGGACLDVFEFEPKISSDLINIENTLLTPHIGSATIQSRKEMQISATNNLIEFLVNGLRDNHLYKFN